MQLKKFYKPVRVVSFVVLGLMLIAVIYALTMSVVLWTGINV